MKIVWGFEHDKITRTGELELNEFTGFCEIKIDENEKYTLDKLKWINIVTNGAVQTIILKNKEAEITIYAVSKWFPIIKKNILFHDDIVFVHMRNTQKAYKMIKSTMPQD